MGNCASIIYTLWHINILSAHIGFKNSVRHKSSVNDGSEVAESTLPSVVRRQVRYMALSAAAAAQRITRAQRNSTPRKSVSSPPTAIMRRASFAPTRRRLRACFSPSNPNAGPLPTLGRPSRPPSAMAQINVIKIKKKIIFLRTFSTTDCKNHHLIPH